MALLRPNAEPAATAVQAGDIFLIDGSTGVRALAATSVPILDVNGNVSVNNAIEGFASTATAGGTTTLSVASAAQQFFTGTLTQTIVLPVVSTFAKTGASFFFQNSSIGALTIQSSGGNTVKVIGPGAFAIVTCIALTGTSAASWQATYFADIVVSGKVLTLNNSLTLAGTDGTVLTFPTTSATIARTDAGQTFTGTQAFGALTAASLNGNTFTTGTGVLTIAAAKTLMVSNSLALAGTDGTTMTFPGTSATLARTDAANVFTGTQTVGALVATTINGNTFTTGTGVLTIAAAKTLTVSNSLTLAGTDATVFTFPGASDTVVTLAATQSLSNKTIAGAALSGTFSGTPTLSGANFITRANLAQVAASSLSGNPTGSLANESAITLGSTLNFSGTTLNATTATGAQLGVVKPDGTTITVAAGVLTAVGAAAASISVGTTTVSSGTSGDILYNNGGVLGNLPIGSLFNSSVTGSSTTYTAAQAGFNVERSNSGAAMADTLPGTGTAVLPANSVVTITNSDASALLAISCASGAVIKGSTVNGFLYLGPGQSVQIQSDGSNYWPIGMSNRARLGAATTFFAASTGSASNHGLTVGSPLASGTAAYNLAQRIVDPNSFGVIIQVADATYTAPIVIDGPIPGQQGSFAQGSVFPVIIQGNLTTPANVLVSVTGSAFGAIQLLNGADVLVQGFKVSTTGAGNGVYVERGSGCVRTMDFGACFINHMCATRGGYLQVVGSYTISGNAQSHALQSNSWISYEGTFTVTFASAIAYGTAFYASQYPGSITFDGTVTYTGPSITSGAKYVAFGNGIINYAGGSQPGPTAGSTSSGGQVLP